MSKVSLSARETYQDEAILIPGSRHRKQIG